MVFQQFTAQKGFRGKEQYTVSIDIPEVTTEAEKRLQNYIIESILLYRSVKLLPFVFNNQSMKEMAKHFLFHRIGSLHTFCSYTQVVYRFCEWTKKQPDMLINDCLMNKTPNIKGIETTKCRIDEYIYWKRQNNSAYRSIQKEIQCIISFFIVNGVKLDLSLGLPGRRTESTIAISMDDIQKLLAVANQRDKAIIGILAVSGLRTSTLARLKYRHVRKELENGVYPVHLAIEPQITKGKYHGYSTFINQEVADCLKEYLDTRRKGTRRVPAEKITDDSPLILCRSSVKKGQIRSIEYSQLGTMFARLCFKAGINRLKDGTGYALNNKSFRKFFRTQMSVLGVQKDYIEYMMGHTNDTYLDIRMVGVECLRRVYRISGISLKDEPELDRFRLLKQTIERLDFRPEDVLKPEILNQLNG